MKIAVVLVTYNRSKCLKVVLEALKNQNTKINSILIVDNCSNDDTQEMLKSINFISEFENEKLIKNISDECTNMYYKNSNNLGGAGGFQKAIEIISQFDYDYVWIMDDDVKPEPDCLEKLLNALEENHCKAAIPNRTDEYYSDNACKFIDLKKFTADMVARKHFYDKPFNEKYYNVVDMPFEGPLIAMDVIKKIGSPDSNYFIYFDDTDYARRILAHSKIMFVKDACLHRQLAKFTEAKTAKEKRKYNWQNYYNIRNNILFNFKYGQSIRAKYFSIAFTWGYHVVRSIIFGEFKNIKIVNKAVHDGVHKNAGKTVNPGEF